MESKELKFVLKLLGCTEYRSLVSDVIFDTFKQDKRKICHALRERGLVDFDREIMSVKLTSAGKNVLKMDMTKLPISPVEYKFLQSLMKDGGKVVPSQIKGMKNLKVTERDALIETLAEKGMVAIESGMKKQKCQVWLTQAGLDYLKDKFTALGTQPVISLDLLSNYLQFMRKTSEVSLKAKPSDEEVLETIRELDRKHRTDNYLPIFHLRKEFSLSRDELDGTLYRLQKSQKIELSSLGEPRHYTEEQLEAGISQNVGGPLFFIIVK
jgi:hypothetical protein